MIPFFSNMITNKTFISVLITAFICSIISIFYINNINTKWQSVVSKQEARIVELEKKHQESQLQISNLSGQLLVANQNTRIIEEKAKKLQNTVNQLIVKYDITDEMPTTVTTFDSPVDELKVIKAENTQMKEDIKIFISEIKVDRELIEAQNKELVLHVKKEDLLTQDIKTLEELNNANKEVLEDLKTKLADETTKKKSWRLATGATGSTLVLTIILIILL